MDVLVVSFKCQCKDAHLANCQGRAKFQAAWPELKIRMSYLIAPWHPTVKPLGSLAIDGTGGAWPFGFELTNVPSLLERVSTELRTITGIEQRIETRYVPSHDEDHSAGRGSSVRDFGLTTAGAAAPDLSHGHSRG